MNRIERWLRRVLGRERPTSFGRWRDLKFGEANLGPDLRDQLSAAYCDIILGANSITDEVGDFRYPQHKEFSAAIRRVEARHAVEALIREVRDG